MHKKIIKTLEQHNYEAYLVGGAVRDIVMGKIPKDFDVVTNAKPNELKGIFKNEKISLVGENFNVMIINGIEVASYRIDKYEDNKLSVQYTRSLLEDLSRRDLTINAMSMNKYGKIFDPFNGIEDIRLRTIKFVGNPHNRIKQDPVRILRAFVRCCDFPVFYNIDKNSYKAMKENIHLIKDIPKERIRLEILRAMKTINPSLFFNLLKEFDILKDIFPSLDAGYYHFDNNYHNETIFLHNMICGDSISKRKPLLRLAGYLHDVGKPEAFDGVNYRKHDKIGAEIIKRELGALKFSTEEIKYITGLIDIHMVGMLKIKPKTARRLFIKLKERGLHWKDLIQLRIGDRKGNLKNENYSKKDIRNYTICLHKELKRKPPFAIRDLDISGNDIMKIKKIPPSQEVGRILKELFKIIVDYPHFNERYILINLVKHHNL